MVQLSVHLLGTDGQRLFFEKLAQVGFIAILLVIFLAKCLKLFVISEFESDFNILPIDLL